jgi:hypothetical protein
MNEIEIIEVGPEEPEPKPVRARWRESARRGGALAVAFVVGVAIGAYGWDGWQDRQAREAERSRVDLALVSASFAYPEPGREPLTLINIRVENRGSLPVTVLGAEMPRTGVAIEGITPQVLPRRDVAWLRLPVRFDCTVVSGTALPPTVTIQVRTADGRKRQQDVPLAESAPTWWEMRGVACRPPSPGDLLMPVYTGDVDERAVSPERRRFRTYFSIGTKQRGPWSVRIAGVNADIPGISAVTGSAGGFPVVITTGQGQRLPVTWEVTDCRYTFPLTERMISVILYASMGDRTPEEVWVSHSSGFAEDITRLREGVCGRR